jgi:nucleoside-diphosphate-sugar epimerase
MKRLLVTGALGHIGSRFIHTLRPGEFDDVLLLDDLSAQRFSSLFNLPQGIPFRFVQDDVCTARLERYCDGMDAVIHLAAITDAASSFGNEAQVEQVNFAGTERIARACAAAGCKLVFLSTTSVYGTQEDVVDESCSVAELQPQSPYAESKLRAEQRLQELAASSGLRFVTCRFGTIFGSSIGMRFHTAVNKFCWQASAGLPLSVWRTALHQRRPYLELGDAVRSLRFILERDLFAGEIYNVLTINATVGEIVDAIRRHIPDLQVELVNAEIMNQLSYTVSCEKFRALGFEFRGSIAQGIEETLQLLRVLGQHAHEPLRVS